MSAPFQAVWNARQAVFEPLSRFHNVLCAEYGDGEVVTLVRHEERSQASHSHYFAAVHEAWQNLPDDLAERFPTSEHLRKYALCKTGFADQRTIVCASKAEAQRMAAFIKPLDEYAVVTAQEATVTVWTAQSQSMRAMGREIFATSKDAVLGILAQMIGVDELTLRRNAGVAA